MTSVARRLARPEILSLAPFDIAAAANSRFGPDAIKLDANENPYPPLAGGSLAAGLNRYPEPQPDRLCSAMAALYGAKRDEILVTRGADDAIDILVRAFCRPGIDKVAISTPTFSAYAHFAQVQGAAVLDIPLSADFSFDAEGFADAILKDGSVKLAFVCAPNNPTGSDVDPAILLELAGRLPDTLLVIDEAYGEFSAMDSLAPVAGSTPNLVVLRTLSKAFGLAGARIGCAIGNAEVVAMAGRALPPYPLPSLSIEAALAALSPSRRPIHEERIARIIEDREKIARLLVESPIVRKLRSGGGNFLFLEVDEPEALAARLQQSGIRVRFRPNAAPGGVRLSIGTKAENEAALTAFGIRLPTKPQPRRAEIVRETKETRISVIVDLDSPEPRRIDTGLPFYDHMLDQVAAHGGFGLILRCDGDHDIDSHHSIEDCAIALGSAFRDALGEKRGIGRFGFALPMDETQAQVLIDLSGRPFSRFEGSFVASHVGAYPTEMTEHVFRSLADSMSAAIHVKVDGNNDHHKTEACYKAFGRALRQAIRREGDPDSLPSTKGML